jgi:hypothetical protein
MSINFILSDRHETLWLADQVWNSTPEPILFARGLSNILRKLSGRMST